MIKCLALILCLFGTEILGIEKCYWISCSVLDDLSQCGQANSGEAKQMLKDEKASRYSGSLFLRECIMIPPEKFSLDWEGKSNALFRRSQ